MASNPFGPLGPQARARYFCALPTCGREVEWRSAIKDGRDGSGKPRMYCNVEHRDEHRAAKPNKP